MIPRSSRRLWALALALAVTGLAARDARANAITDGTIGWVDTPAGGTPSLITYHGTTGTVTGQGSLNLGQFVVTAAAQKGAPVDYTGDKFHVIAYSGPNQSELLTGTFKGMVGLGVTTPLTATIDSLTMFGGALPFTLSVPTGVAMTLNTAPGSSTASVTIFSAAASPIPEPTSVAVFAAALSCLALWRRRASR